MVKNPINPSTSARSRLAKVVLITMSSCPEYRCSNATQPASSVKNSVTLCRRDRACSSRKNEAGSRSCSHAFFYDCGRRPGGRSAGQHLEGGRQPLVPVRYQRSLQRLAPLTVPPTSPPPGSQRQASAAGRVGLLDPFLLGPIFKEQASGATRRLTSTRPKDATCGETSSGCATGRYPVVKADPLPEVREEQPTRPPRGVLGAGRV